MPLFLNSIWLGSVITFMNAFRNASLYCAIITPKGLLWMSNLAALLAEKWWKCFYVFTGNAVCSRGRRNGFIFTPACFITSDAFLNRLMKGKAVEADGSSYRLPASVLPDNGNQRFTSLNSSDKLLLTPFCRKSKVINPFFVSLMIYFVCFQLNNSPC